MEIKGVRPFSTPPAEYRAPAGRAPERPPEAPGDGVELRGAPRRMRRHDHLAPLAKHYPSLQRALDALERDGRLTKGVREALEKLADPSTPLAAGIERGELVKEAAKDLANPSQIRQGRKETCAATAAQISLAMRRPERYLEILAALASPEGDASRLVPGPPPLARPGDAPLEKPEGDGRSITTRIMNPSFNDFANGALVYRDDEDRSYEADGATGALKKETERLGIMPAESVRMDEEIVKVPSHLMEEKAGEVSGDDIFREVKAALGRGQAVPVGLKWRTRSAGHRVVVTRIGRDPVDKKQYAYVINPWGRRQTVPLDAFRQMLRSASIPDEGNPRVKLPSALAAWSSYEPLDPYFYQDILKS